MENDVQRVEKIIDSALETLRKEYKVSELDAGKFAVVKQSIGTFEIRHFAVEGVGHLQTMEIKESPMMKMATFTLTPFTKNMPLFSADFMLMGDKRMTIMEIYELVKDTKDPSFRKMVDEFKDVFDEISAIPDIPQQPIWYDDIRPVFVAKAHTPNEDDMILDNLLKIIALYAKKEKELPLLNEEDKKVKYDLTKDYVEHLIREGGVATENWKKEMGIDFVNEFFHKIFFGLE